MKNTDKFIELYSRINKDLPGFKEASVDNSEDYYDLEGRFLPYVFMSDLAKYYVKKVKDGNLQEVNIIHDILISLLKSKDDDLETLCVVGFLESVPHTDEIYSKIKTLLPEMVLAELKKLEIFWHGEELVD